MLVANDRLQEALTELDTLKVITPKESLVYFLIGKVSSQSSLYENYSRNKAIGSDGVHCRN